MNNSFDDQEYGITYIFPAERQLTRDEMIAAIAKVREEKSVQLLDSFMRRNKAELTEEQKMAKAKELLEQELNRGGTVIMTPITGEDTDSEPIVP